MLHDEAHEIPAVEPAARELTAPEQIDQALRIAIAGLELIQRQLPAEPGRELSCPADMVELELIREQLVRQHEALAAAREADRVVRASEQLILAQERAARAEAERAARMRADVLLVVIHDLKNPLMTIKVAAEVLRRKLEAMDAPEIAAIRPWLGSLISATARMTSQINELADVARLEIGEAIGLNRRPVDLVELARRLVADHQPTARRTPTRLKAAQPEVVGIWDPERLERVLSNLLMNALKYSPRGGAITVSVARRRGAGGTWAVLTVRDRGIGIPTADLPHIFERYFRAANAGHLMGSGLGLAGVRQIAEQHGGTVTVESKEGHGATFTVRLPLSPRPQA